MKLIFVRLLERLLRKRVLTPAHVDHARIKRILVIRQHDMLGDFLLATPVLRALRINYPDAHIAVLVRDYFLDTVLHNPNLDDILIVHKSGNQWNLKNIWRLMRKLIKQWDLTIVLNTVSHSVTSDLFALLSSRHYVLGSSDRVFPGCSRNFLYNLIAPFSPGQKHQTDRNLDIVRYIGVDTNDFSEQMQLLPREIGAACERLKRLGVQSGRPVIGMHVGAGKLKNRWPVERFARLARMLGERYDAQIVLCWGTSEGELADSFGSLVDLDLFRIPPTTLRDLAAVFTQCDLVVCNDTGVMHVCAAVGVPLVAIFGPTNPVEWKPVGDSFLAIRGPDGTVEGVGVEQVFEQVKALIDLKEHSKPTAVQPQTHM